MADLIKSWRSQVRKGTAEITILSLLNQSPKSGIGLLGALEKYPGIGIAEGSIYPLLIRLEKEGRVRGDWVSSTTGSRNQKVYAVTTEGKEALSLMRQFWRDFHEQVTQALGEEDD